MARLRKEGIRFEPFSWSRKPENRARRPDRRILLVLQKMCGKYGHHYCFPSQQTILDKLERWYGADARMSRRHLCRNLNTLQFEAFVHRKRRIEYVKPSPRRRHSGLLRRSTMYYITLRDVATLGGAAIAIAKALRASSHVPQAAQYLRFFIKDLNSALSYAQGRAPP